MRSLVFVFLLAVAVYAAGDSKHECLRSALGLTNSLTQARGAYDIRNILTMYTTLEQSMQQAVTNCGLNLQAATKRCEAAYPGRCEQISPAAIQVKCDPRFRRVGAGHCAMNCPTSSWREDEYHCYKPATIETLVFVNELSFGEDCEEIAGKFVKICAEGSKRLGLRNCVAVCPLGWHDEGARCRKPAVYRLTQPFYWTQGDN